MNHLSFVSWLPKKTMKAGLWGSLGQLKGKVQCRVRYTAGFGAVEGSMTLLNLTENWQKG